MSTPYRTFVGPLQQCCAELEALRTAGLISRITFRKNAGSWTVHCYR